MRLSVVVGTRPEIIKIRSVLAEARARGHDVSLTHAGQHYDFEMSGVFFEELQIEPPRNHLEIGAGSHAAHLARGAVALERLIATESPDAVIVVGDTDSTLLGTIVASKLGVAVAHVEAGVRSDDWTMPEEINRRAVDAIATLCFAPTPRAMGRLNAEGRGVDSTLVGDTLIETAREVVARGGSSILEALALAPRRYGVGTIHRPANTNDPSRLGGIFSALGAVGIPVVVPLHPRTRQRLADAGVAEFGPMVRAIPPVGYADFLTLLGSAKIAFTDSGGVQQEAAFLGVPLITLRENTEWVETVEAGKNVLVGSDPERIRSAAQEILTDDTRWQRMSEAPSPFELGAARRILDALESADAAGRLAYRSSNFLRDGLPRA